MSTFSAPFEGLRWIIETKQRGRGGRYAPVAVVADFGDAVYLADAHFTDGESVRVIDPVDGNIDYAIR